MSINLKEFNIIKQCSGNGVNKIYVVQSKETKEKFVVKIIELQNEER